MTRQWIAVVLLAVLLATPACGGGSTPVKPVVTPSAEFTVSEAELLRTSPAKPFEPLPGRYGLFVMGLDGSDLRQIYASDQRLIGPRLSPDDTTLAFSQFARDLNDDGQFNEADMAALEIGLMGVDGSDHRLLTNNDFIDAAPACSPDGSQILFASNRGDGDKLDLSVMDLEGNVLRQLTATPEVHEGDPDWVWNTIVYTYNRTGEDTQSLWVMNADGSNARQVTFPPEGEANSTYKPGDFDPCLSPDGRWIAWERHLEGEFTIRGHSIGRWDIFVIGADGTGERDLTNAVEAAAFPHWSPDGSQILFYAYTDGEHPAAALYVMNADGSNRRPITVPVPTLMVLGGDWFLTAEGLQVVFTAEVLRQE